MGGDLFSEFQQKNQTGCDQYCRESHFVIITRFGICGLRTASLSAAEKSKRPSPLPVPDKDAEACDMYNGGSWAERPTRSPGERILEDVLHRSMQGWSNFHLLRVILLIM